MQNGVITMNKLLTKKRSLIFFLTMKNEKLKKINERK